ncbi:hypothetical protein TWF506_001067 [Arthrobotrys conoides]|uniref:Uncharacterized protein n=1 Tax=Arthrobotrys conoides TaxID=74498 RepID=A0AAN8NFA0_9PEZI
MPNQRDTSTTEVPKDTSRSKQKQPPTSSGPSITKKARRTREEAIAETEESPAEPRRYNVRNRAPASSSKSPKTLPRSQGTAPNTTGTTITVVPENPTGQGVDATFGNLFEVPRRRNPRRRHAPGGVPFGATFNEGRAKLCGWRVKTLFPCGEDLLPLPRRSPCCPLAGKKKKPTRRRGTKPPAESASVPLGPDSSESAHVGTGDLQGGPSTRGRSKRKRVQSEDAGAGKKRRNTTK